MIPSHNAVIRVYDLAGNVIDMHEHKGDFKLMAKAGIGRIGWRH
jgi:glutamate formiminotransferase